MAPCLPESSSDEELFILPPKKVILTTPRSNPNGHLAPVTRKKPSLIPRMNGKSLEQAKPRLHSSPAKPSSPTKKIYTSAPAILEASSEDEPITVRPKKKKYQKKKKRPRKQEEDDDDEAIVSKKKKAKTTKKKVVRKPKKVFELPGQRKDIPHELDGGRIFYESLRKQIPTSKMAEEYLLKHGLLPLEEAQKIVDKMEEAKQNKSGSAKKKSGSTRSSPKKARKTNTNTSKRKSKSSKKGSKGMKGSKLKKKRKRRKKKIEIMSGESSDDEALVLR